MKQVIVTGVLGGIGEAIAEEFASAGFSVIGLDIREGASPHVSTFRKFDIEQYVRDEAFRDREDRWFDDNVRNLKCLINNAAVQRLGSIKELALEDWEETLAVNVTGPMLLSQRFVEDLEREAGNIINIASIHNNLTKRRFISYATSKSALIGLTKALSVDLQGRVTVNAISPAAIDTQMLREGFAGDEDKVRQLDMLHPSQRIGRPHEVAKLCVFLSQNHFDFVHGTNIEMDGGISNVLKDLE